ncbi:hypothetical protein FHT77_001545 [Rhizobium sp. BK181]|nr:hypothetical protein [Rhizobium sp. BK181]
MGSVNPTGEFMDDMCPGPWNVCVLARTGKNGALEFIGTAEEALRKLKSNWFRPGPAFALAVESCQDVVRSWAPSYLARIAFEEAVREAGLHL